MKKQKIKDAIKRNVPVVVALGVGVAIPILLGYKKPVKVDPSVWIRHTVTPEDLRWLADNPNEVLVSRGGQQLLAVVEKAEV